MKNRLIALLISLISTTPAYADVYLVFPRLAGNGAESTIMIDSPTVPEMPPDKKAIRFVPENGDTIPHHYHLMNGGIYLKPAPAPAPVTPVPNPGGFMVALIDADLPVAVLAQSTVIERLAKDPVRRKALWTKLKANLAAPVVTAIEAAAAANNMELK